MAFGWLWRLRFCHSLLYSWKMVISSFYGHTPSCLFLIKQSAILGNANKRKQQIHIYMTGCLARYQQRKATTGIKLSAFSCMTYTVGTDERAFLSPGSSILENFSLFSLCFLIFIYRRAQRLLFQQHSLFQPFAEQQSLPCVQIDLCCWQMMVRVWDELPSLFSF